MDENQLYETASKRVDEKLGFYRHLAAYVIVNAFLIALNLIRSPDVRSCGARRRGGKPSR